MKPALPSFLVKRRRMSRGKDCERRNILVAKERKKERKRKERQEEGTSQSKRETKRKE
jgi:hypothetical protein